QVYGYLMEKILAAGALDIFYTPVQMKKNRPGILLTVLSPKEKVDKLTGIIFTETSTIGLRYYETERRTLARETIPLLTDYGTVRLKVATDGAIIVNAMPEYEDCSKLAREAGVSLAVVQASAMSAFKQQRELVEKTIKEGRYYEHQ
ncbi:MAG: DUF111 family protein, partial [Blastocatellia bacterium]|nr:DUF111 family protein [Blastocatellia bacterium]